MRVVFDGKSIKVCTSAAYYSEFDVTFVTFSAWSPSGVGNAFGKGFFESNKITAYHITQKHNHWWHTDEMYKAIERIISDSKCQNFILYGASMGGYGVIHFQRYFPTITSIAISPQSYIDVKNISETRWKSERENIQRIFDEKDNIENQVGELIVISDSFHKLDKIHVDFLTDIKDSSTVFLVDAPYTNHETPRVLSAIKVLQGVLIDLAKYKSFNIPLLQYEANSAYLKDPKVFFNFFRMNFFNTGDKFDEYVNTFKKFVASSRSLDFESAYMVAEIYANLGMVEEAVIYSDLSIEYYPNQTIPEYLSMKKAGIEKKFNLLGKSGL